VLKAADRSRKMRTGEIELALVVQRAEVIQRREVGQENNSERDNE
jgi:hypothetical protein